MPVMTKTPNGEDIVIMSRQEFDELTSQKREDEEDIRLAKEIMVRIADGTEETLTSEELDEYLAAATPLVFWRNRRGLTLAALAAEAEIAPEALSEIESGTQIGDPDTLGRIAGVLRVRPEDLAA